MAYIGEKTQEYLTQLDLNDFQENGITINKIQQKIARLKTNKIGYELLEEKLKASGFMPNPETSGKENTRKTL